MSVTTNRNELTPRVRLLTTRNAFFEDGDIYCNLQSKYMLTDRGQEQQRLPEFDCHVAGCHLQFSMLSDYDSHYNSVHRNVCRVCHRVLPSNHLLEIHVLEWHDSLFDVLAAKQPMFQCLVQSCQEKFPDQDTRRKHLLTCHQYPHNFRFDKHIKRRGVKSLDCGDDIMEVGAEQLDKTVDTRSVSGGRRVPTEITFGRGRPRTFQRRQKSSQRKFTEEEDDNGDDVSQMDES